MPDVGEILRPAAERGRTRLLVREQGVILGAVHARDAGVARARGRAPVSWFAWCPS